MRRRLSLVLSILLCAEAASLHAEPLQTPGEFFLLRKSTKTYASMKMSICELIVFRTAGENAAQYPLHEQTCAHNQVHLKNRNAPQPDKCRCINSVPMSQKIHKMNGNGDPDSLDI